MREEIRQAGPAKSSDAGTLDRVKRFGHGRTSPGTAKICSDRAPKKCVQMVEKVRTLTGYV